MEFGINNYKDLAEFISYVIASISLASLWIAYVYSKKQIHFSTMEKCINDYRNWMQESDKSADDIAHEYLDLVNEEFFYIEKGYLPFEVGEEWIDGMIDFLPFFYQKNKFIPSDNLKAFQNEEWTRRIINGYPRVFKALSLKKKTYFENLFLDIDIAENLKLRNLERKKLIYRIMLNLNTNSFLKLKLYFKINSLC